MNKKWIVWTVVVLMAGAVGCATIPPGPSVMVLPAQGKSFQEFQTDDYVCRQWAEQQTGWRANETVNQNVASGAAIGTLMGAGLGAAIGSMSGKAGAGAGIGALGGMIAGTAASSSNAHDSGMEVQRRYDIAYQQCMYSRGNQIPGRVQTYQAPQYIAPPPPPPPSSTIPPASAVSPPPPPAGSQPPPPPPVN